MVMLVRVPDALVPSSRPLSLPDSELRAVRAQAALVRSLLDELDEIVPPSDAPGSVGRPVEALAAQTVEELANLARRMMEAAAAMAPRRFAAMQLDHGMFAAAESAVEPSPAR